MAEVEVLIPIVLFICMAIIFCTLFWFRYRTRNDMQQTVRTALDKGQELSPEIVERLGQPRPAKNRDLRLGTIWLAIAAGLALMGFAIPEEEALRGLLAAAALPLCIGLALLVLHKFSDQDR